jgi:DNA polymerase-3 subunit chi
VTRRLELHPLPGAKRAGALCHLLEKLYKQRRRVVVWVGDEGRLQILDDYLWSFRRLSFVPHAVWSPELGDLDEPVVLLAEPANPNRAEVMVVGDDPPPGDWAATFDEVHDLVPPGDGGEERRRFWQQWRHDHDVEYGEEAGTEGGLG